MLCVAYVDMHVCQCTYACICMIFVYNPCVSVQKLATANEALEGEITGLTSKLGQVEKGRLELMEQMQSLREAIRDSDMKRGDTESRNKIMKGQVCVWVGGCECVWVWVWVCACACVRAHVCAFLVILFHLSLSPD